MKTKNVENREFKRKIRQLNIVTAVVTIILLAALWIIFKM